MSYLLPKDGRASIIATIVGAVIMNFAISNANSGDWRGFAVCCVMLFWVGVFLIWCAIKETR